MKKTEMETLIELQSVDGQIYALKAYREEKPEVITVMRNRLLEKEKVIKGFEDGLKTIQVKRKEKEVDLASKEATIKKYNLQLMSVKTNKEYTSLQKEIEGSKADNSVLEEEILNLMEDIDLLKERVSKDSESLIQEKSKLELEGKKLNLELQTIDEELKSLYSQRNGLLPMIENTVLSMYEKILANKNGVAVVSLVGESCQGCFMKVPPQVINEIKMEDKLIICDNCSRILYINE